ncbi:MAG: tyrosine-type recombinase/integrase, partial [Stackebrandtia sp.]
GARCPHLRRAGGAWHPTHGVWAYQIELPRSPDGQRRQLRRTPAAVPNTREAAKDERDHARGLLDLAGNDTHLRGEIATLLRNIPRGCPLPSRDTVARRLRVGAPAESLTVGDYLKRWIAGRRIDEATIKTYTNHIRHHLVPHLGHIPLQRLAIEDISAMFTAIAERNQQILQARNSDDLPTRANVKGKRTVSAATMNRVRSTLRRALNDAIRKDRLLEHNPAAHVEPPKEERPKGLIWTMPRVAHWKATGKKPGPVMVWTPDQAGCFLDHVEAHDPDMYPIYALVLRLGLRRGEAVGLAADHLDLHNATATITRQLAVHHRELVYKKVKTTSGERTIALDSHTIADLTRHNARRAAHKLAAGPAWPDTIQLPFATPGGRSGIDVDLYFRQPDGRPWHPDAVYARFRNHIKKA